MVGAAAEAGGVLTGPALAVVAAMAAMAVVGVLGAKVVAVVLAAAAGHQEPVQTVSRPRVPAV